MIGTAFARGLGAILIMTVVLAACGDGAAGTDAGGSITVTDARIRVTSPDQPAGGYLVIANASGDADAMTGVSSPAFASVQLHETVTMTAEPGDSGGGMMGMQPVTEILVPANGSVALEPGGYHLMLMQPTGTLAVGDTIELTLTFRNASPISVSATVEGP